MSNLLIDLGHIGHKSEKLKKLFPTYSEIPNESGYFLEFKDYKQLEVNEGVLVVTNAFESEQQFKDRLSDLLLYNL